MVIFGKNLDLTVVIVTLAVVTSSIIIWNEVIIKNVDYGAFTAAIRLLALCGVCVSFALVVGCIAQYYGWAKEDIESMAPKQ
jgi:hypothetical protein